ncbi:uncharacterized protein J3R85_001393 [Psidium guajava]|nr:uncharacterized protein J3R85_001393 [Psidium guajava]
MSLKSLGPPDKTSSAVMLQSHLHNDSFAASQSQQIYPKPSSVKRNQFAFPCVLDQSNQN